MHGTVAHHQLTDDQPVPEQWKPTCSTAPVLLLSMTLCGVEYPFGALGELSWLCTPRSSLCTPNSRWQAA